MRRLPLRPCSMCIPFRLMERICPLGRILAVPPPLRATCFPGRGRLTLDTEPAPPLPALAPPFLPIVEPAPVLPAFPVLFNVPVPVLAPPGLVPAAVPGLVPAAPGRFAVAGRFVAGRSEEHTSELQSRENLVCRLLLEKKKKKKKHVLPLQKKKQQTYTT